MKVDPTKFSTPKALKRAKGKALWLYAHGELRNLTRKKKHQQQVMFAIYCPNEITHAQAHIRTLPSRGKL